MDARERYKDGEYLRQHPTWHQADSKWKASQIVRLIRKHELPVQRICEVGCGAGEVLNCLSTELPSTSALVGFEVSPQAYEICKAKETATLKYRLEDPMVNVQTDFDIALAIDVMEHVEDCFGFLRGLRRMAPHKILHIPLDLSVQSVLRGSRLLRLRASVGHIHYFTKDLALAILRETGYQVVEWCYTKSAIELPNRGLRANLFKVPRTLLFALDRDLAVRLLGGFSLLVLAR